MKGKLVVLYLMLVVFIGFGAFSLWQFVVPMFQVTETEEEPYAFTELQELVKAPDTEAEDDTVLKYDAEVFYAKNNDFVGWLSIPDTTVSFPVVQAQDNSFYLKRGFDKAYSSYGCPFLDIRTPIGGGNLVVHGHNMGNNRTEVFSPLLRFQNPDYAKQHTIAYFAAYPSNTQTQYTLFSVVNFNLNNDFDYFFSDFEDEEHRKKFLSFLKEYSLYDSEFVPDGNILILSTCNNTYGKNNRLLLCYGEVENAE